MSEMLTETLEKTVDEPIEEGERYYDALDDVPEDPCVEGASPDLEEGTLGDGLSEEESPEEERESDSEQESARGPIEGLPRSSEITTKELGKRGENAAANYLVRKGYQILERNWTCKFGEADIIALDDEGTIVFVEVKTRRSLERGLPEEAITREKQQRYEKLALTYLIEADWNDDVNLRFDAIGICVDGDYHAILKHHLGCFNAIH